MKQFKDRQGKGKELRAPARYKSLMVSKDNLSDGTFKTMMDAGVKQMLVKQPETVPSRLKASVIDMPMKHMKQELATPDEYEGLSKAEKKALIKLRKKERRGTKPEKKARKEARKKAEVTPIIKEKPPVVAPVSGTDDEVTHCDPVKPAKLSRRQRRKAAKALKDAKAEQIKKLEEIVEGDDTAANEERALIGPPQQEPVAPEPDTPVKTEKKDSVKPQLTVVPTGNEPKIIGKIHHFGSSKALGKTVPIQSELPASPRKTRGYTNLARKSDAAEASGNDEHVATTPVEVVDTELYGTCIRDTGSGMTPSGMPISDFLVGGKYPPPSKSQGVTPSNSDYTYEELGELLDAANLELQSDKFYLGNRIKLQDETIKTMAKTHEDLRAKLRLSGFHQAHVPTKASDSEVVVELQDMNTLLTEDNDALREELDKQADRYDQVAVQAHHMQSDGTFKKVSVNSKATMNTLGLQYGIFASNFKDDPVRCFLKHTGYPLANLKPLKAFFDEECEERLVKNAQRLEGRKVWTADRAVYESWGARTLSLPKRDERQDFVTARLERIMAPKRAMFKECSVYIGWGNRTTTLKYARVNNLKKRVAHAGKYDVRPRYHWSARMDYYQWWMENLSAEDANLRSLRQTFTAKKIIKPIKTVVDSISKVLMTELNPLKRKAKRIADSKKAKAKRIAIKKNVKASGAKASRIKREQEATFEKELHLEQAKAAMKTAH